ncbi:MAG TPA: antitoxin Xre/MbcA/ParS toxin-binding domain-containing protein [Stellaceae bacterium]|jgi:putative toxin-antitoxin system antitoxin component (TIGR02293 family)|nr:antitoxin Xre/MbcA/ParS toxin-binding domain-containing protein [Stellaceae bacterium]
METPYAELAGMLGILGPGDLPPGPVQLVGRIQEGLPITTLYNVSTRIAPGDTQFVFRIVPKASLARRKHGRKLLTAEQSNRLARLAGVWALAESVWRDQGEARDFLFRPHGLLEMRRPIDLAIESELGAELVKNILGRLLYGTAA